MKKTNLTTLVRNIFLTIPLYCAAFIGCGEEVTEVTNVTNEVTGMEQVKKYSDLPKCSSDNFGSIFYVSDSAKVFYCNEKKWLTLNGSNGKDGTDGKNGKDGKDGTDGKDGADGKDGISPVLFDSAGNYIPGNGDSITIVIKNYGKTVTGLGECTSKREGEIAHLDSVDNPLYYICKSKSWKTATPLEYDTYKWADTTDGASKLGNVTKKMYVFDKTKWRAAIGAEIELGLCIEKRTGEVSKYYEIYFTCNNRQWSPSTLLEYDTYGKDCLENGSIDSGKIFPYNKYVCDRGMFRFATPMELAMNQGCTSYNKGEQRRYQYSNYICDPDSSTLFHIYDNIHDDSVTIIDRDSSGWSFDFAHLNKGSIKDSRDGQVYKTIGIKKHMWINENIRYNKKGSYCFKDSSQYCNIYGRFYSLENISDVCPEGWHIPAPIEYDYIDYETRGRSTYSANVLHQDESYYYYGFNIHILSKNVGDNQYTLHINQGSLEWSTSEGQFWTFGTDMKYGNIIIRSGVIYDYGPNYKISDYSYIGYYNVRCIKD